MKTTFAIGTVAAAMLLASCGTPADTDTVAAQATEAASQFNEQDAEFLTDMIPHHEQALQMVDMTDGRELSPEFAELTAAIEAAQGPEIDLMTEWLTAWGLEVPESTGHEGMHHDDGTGMMSAEDFESLGRESGDGFEEMWMRMMIEHHEGAVAMSEVELDEGINPEVRDLAQRIIDAQEAEIELMTDLLEAS